MILRLSSLLRNPVFQIRESPRPAPPECAASADEDEFARLHDELERIGSGLYRVSLAQDSLARSVDQLARTALPPAPDEAERLAQQFLPLMDALYRLTRALAMYGTGLLEPLAVGARIVEAKGESYLAAMGVTAIPALGVAFNPELHQAVGTRETEPDQEGIILEEIMRGYRMGDRVLRPAQVGVGRKHESAGERMD